MKKRNYIIALVLLLAIGFASVSTSLIVTGVVGIGENANDFDVYYSNALVDGVEDKSVIKEDQVISFKHRMDKVDEVYTIKYDVTNGSKNYDASLTMTCTESNDYLEITNDFDVSTVLSSKATRTGTLTIKVKKAFVGNESGNEMDIPVECELVASPESRDTLDENDANDKINRYVLVDDLLDKANAATITSYDAGNKAEMYTFNHAATGQTNALVDYRYIGASPKNYVKINDDLWRIVGVFTTDDGEQRVKLISETSPVVHANFDENGSTAWQNASIKNLMPSLIDSDVLAKSDEVKYYLGGLDMMAALVGNPTPASMYELERGTTVASGLDTYWNGKVGLMYPSDYFYTYDLGVNTSCATSARLCSDPSNSWLYKGEFEYLISNYHNQNMNFNVVIYEDGKLSNTPSDRDYLTRPVVYLKPDTKYAQGTGSLEDPYRIF